jgi:uncharacterized protein YoxC
MRDALPDLIHVVMFYNEGTVFETTFEQPINIPELGSNLAEALKRTRKLFEIAQIHIESYKKFIYETDHFIVIILKLGENSNIALFFKKGEATPDISNIRRYLFRIEDLMDTDKLDLEKHALELKKQEVNEFETQIKANLDAIEQMKREISDLDLEIQKFEKEITDKKTDIQYEDTIQEKFEQLIEQTQEVIEDVETKEIKKTLEKELKEDKKDLKTIGKTLSKEEKVIDKLEDRIQDIEEKKQDILSDINAILEQNKNLQEKINTKATELAALEEKIQQLEKEKFERKFLEH